MAVTRKLARSQLSELTLVGTLCFYRVPSDPRFAVSECGQVIGARRKVLKPRSNGRYAVVGYRDKNKPGGWGNHYIHRLVAEVFHGASELEVNHKDGDKSNNHWENLEYVTRKENYDHGVSLGLHWNAPKPGQRGFQCAN